MDDNGLKHVMLFMIGMIACVMFGLTYKMFFEPSTIAYQWTAGTLAYGVCPLFVYLLYRIYKG